MRLASALEVQNFFIRIMTVHFMRVRCREIVNRTRNEEDLDAVLIVHKTVCAREIQIAEELAQHILIPAPDTSAAMPPFKELQPAFIE